MNQSNQKAFYRLSQVTTRLSIVLKPSMEKSFWLRAEVSSASFTRGHFYCDLVETDGKGNQVAKMRCTIWKGQLAAIQRKFNSAGLELELENGKQIGVFCSLTFHAVHGIALNVVDADPAFAIGEIELRRRELLLKLEHENLFDSNKRIQVPLLPQRIGVITSKSSAGYRDFFHTIEKSGFGFQLFLADATMQGQGTEKQVCRSFDKLCRLPVDLIVIIRGGGSKTDLSHLDSEKIARRIAGSSLPVWTGIGHETDESVLDFVANQNFKTPTAVAVALVDRFSAIEKRIGFARKRLETTWSYRCSNQHKSFDRWKTGLRQGTRKLLEFSRTNLNRQVSELKSVVGSRVSASTQKLSGARSDIQNMAARLIYQHENKLASSRSSIFTLARKRLEFSNAIIERLSGRFRPERFEERILIAQMQLKEKRLQLDREAAQMLDRQWRDLQRKRSAFRLSRYLFVLDRAKDGLIVKQRLVRAVDPTNALQRGFALVFSPDNRLLISVATIKKNEKLVVKMKDGTINTKVEEIDPK